MRQVDHSGAMEDVKAQDDEKHLNWRTGRRDKREWHVRRKLGGVACNSQQRHKEMDNHVSMAGKEKKIAYVGLKMPSFSPWLI